MSDFYGRLQGTASRLMAQFSQGHVVYTITGPSTGPEWNPAPGAPVSYTLDATVAVVGTVDGGFNRYVDGTLILATDMLVTCAVFAVEPSLAGTITIDGKACQIVRVDKVPGAGTVIAWRIFVRA